MEIVENQFIESALPSGTSTATKEHHSSADEECAGDWVNPAEIEPVYTKDGANTIVSQTSIQSICSAIQSDMKKLYNAGNKNCNTTSLLEYNPLLWLQERPVEFIQLLKELCGIHGTLMDDKVSLLLAKVVEQIYAAQNSRLVLPLSLRENLLTYGVSNSKLLVNYNGSTSAGGSYSYISKWLRTSASEPLPFPKGLVRSVFDNEQVIGKTYTVKVNNKVSSNVVTSHEHIIIDESSQIQSAIELKPEN